jgi:uncharacterized repeat protein (TIGR01451 family)
MKRIVLISITCVLALGAGAAGATKAPLPAPRVDLVGWSPKSTYTIGEVVTYRFAISNRAHAPLQVLDARLTLPKGWKLVTATRRPFSASSATVVWRYLDVAATPHGLRRLSVSARVGGKPGAACFTQVVRAVRPATYARTRHGCNHVVDSVFH